MTLQTLAAQQRAAILARDAALAKQITAHYQAIWQRILARLQRLTQQIGDAQAAGQPVKVSWLYEQKRLQTFLNQMQADIQQFASHTQGAVQQQMYQAAETGAQDALSLLDHQSGRVYGSFNRVPSEAIRQAIYTTETDAHLQKLFGSFDSQAVDAVKKRLVSAVALGENPRQIAKDIQQALQVPLWRALMIARTETINAYRDSSLNLYRANSDVVRGWTWLAAGGACPICAGLNGSHHDLSEEMDSHPNCFPGDVVVAAPKILGSTTRWFEGEIVEIETALGNFLTVTPNHPILTSEGWVAARALHEGSHVVSCFYPERVAAAINPDDYQVPAFIKDVAATFGRTSRMATICVPTTAEDFHGDGVGSQVCVIRTYRTLGGTGDAKLLSKPLAQQLLCWRHAQLFDLSRLGTLAEGIKRIFLASAGRLSLYSIAPSLLGSASSSQQSIGFSLSPEWDTFITQETFNRAAADTVTFRQFCLRFPGQVTRDNIVKIGRRPFSGHVYNLQTESGWYIANNIIAHNCRCAMTPDTVSYEDIVAAL